MTEWTVFLFTMFSVFSGVCIACCVMFLIATSKPFQEYYFKRIMKTCTNYFTDYEDGLDSDEDEELE